MCPLDTEVIEQPNNVQRHLSSVLLRIVRLFAPAVTAAIQSDDPVVPRQVWQNASLNPPFLHVLVGAVNQDDWFPRSLLNVSNPNPVRGEKLVLRRRDTRQNHNTQNESPSIGAEHLASF
jgi:hypothetical protein